MWHSVKNKLHLKAVSIHHYASCCCKGCLIGLRYIYCSTYFPAFITPTVISSGVMNASSFWVHAHWLSTGWSKHYWLLAIKTVIFIVTKYTCVRHLSLTKPLLKDKVNEAEDLQETLWLWIVWCCSTNWTWPSQSDHHVTYQISLFWLVALALIWLHSVIVRFCGFLLYSIWQKRPITPKIKTTWHSDANSFSLYKYDSVYHNASL